ncbi:MAG: lipopolysaccharide biosynthesis protein [Myxococcales bacterium]|nr:lipopolysaccharide biosynthesis protein [Myxococcales bacterium]
MEPRARSSADETRRAGRGFLTIGAAKVYFIVASFVVQFGLPRLFGDAADFGLYAQAMAGVAILTNVLIAATLQSVSKLVSEAPHRAEATARRAIQLQAVVGGVLAVALAGLAGPLADASRDPALAPLIRAASVVVLSYSVYAALVGRLNGEERFAEQARLDAGFTTLRTTGILAGAALGFGAIGAVAGFALASAAILTIALVRVGLGKEGEAPSLSRFVTFMAPVWVYQGLMNGMLQIDLWVMKPILVDALAAVTASLEEAAARASEIVGHYRGAQNFAFVPYQLVLATTFIVLPMVSRAIASGDEPKARATVRNALRFSLLAAAFFAAPLAGTRDALLGLAYPADYAIASEAFLRLVAGVVPFTVFVVSATILNGAGLPRISALLSLSGVILVVALNGALVARAGTSEPAALEAASTATSVGMLVTCALSGAATQYRFRTFVALATFVRALLASLGAYAAARGIDVFLHGLGGGLAHPFTRAALGLSGGAAAFLVIALLARELGRPELETFRRIVSKKGSSEP